MNIYPAVVVIVDMVPMNRKTFFIYYIVPFTSLSPTYAIRLDRIFKDIQNANDIFSNSTLNVVKSLQFESHQKIKETKTTTLKKSFSLPLLKMSISSKVYKCHKTRKR